MRSDKKVKNGSLIDLDRFRALKDRFGTDMDVSKQTGIDRSLVNYHYNGKRNISLQDLIKYAQCFNVSVDYLLGIEKDDKSDDETTAYISDYTGLSIEAVKYLNNFSRGFQADVAFFDSLIKYHSKKWRFNASIFDGEINAEIYAKSLKTIVNNFELYLGVDDNIDVGIVKSFNDDYINLEDKYDAFSLNKYYISESLRNFLDDYFLSCAKTSKSDLETLEVKIDSIYKKMEPYFDALLYQSAGDTND